MTDQQKQQVDRPDQNRPREDSAPERADKTRNDAARSSERPLEDPTRGRQGDPLEDALPHGGTTQGDRGGTG